MSNEIAGSAPVLNKRAAAGGPALLGVGLAIAGLGAAVTTFAGASALRKWYVARGGISIDVPSKDLAFKHLERVKSAGKAGYSGWKDAAGNGVATQ